MGQILTITYIWARRFVVAVIGGTVVLLGIAMIVLPGPAFVVIPAGLAILGIEFAFARRWLRHLRAKGSQVIDYTFARLPWMRRKSRDEGDRRESTPIESTRTPSSFIHRELAANRSTTKLL